MLGELSVVEQRYLAVREVLDSGCHGYRCGASLWGGSSHCSSLAGPLRQWRFECSGRPEPAA
jgi:hypothetical protein